jgi:hypothetical protein
MLTQCGKVNRNSCAASDVGAQRQRSVRHIVLDVRFTGCRLGLGLRFRLRLRGDVGREAAVAQRLPQDGGRAASSPAPRGPRRSGREAPSSSGCRRQRSPPCGRRHGGSHPPVERSSGRGQDGVEGFRRSGRPRRRAGGEDVVAQPPAAVGELVHESSSAAVGFDQPELVELVASGLVEFRPESNEIGVGHWTRLGHQHEEYGSFGSGQICRRDTHGANRSGMGSNHHPEGRARPVYSSSLEGVAPFAAWGGGRSNGWRTSARSLMIWKSAVL